MCVQFLQFAILHWSLSNKLEKKSKRKLTTALMIAALQIPLPPFFKKKSYPPRSYQLQLRECWSTLFIHCHCLQVSSTTWQECSAAVSTEYVTGTLSWVHLLWTNIKEAAPRNRATVLKGWNSLYFLSLSNTIISSFSSYSEFSRQAMHLLEAK